MNWFRVFRNSKLEPKDYISISISVVALLATLFTLYKTYVETDDDLAFIIDKLPDFRITKGDGDNLFITLSARHNVTFINSGNRSAAILGMTIAATADTPANADPKRCPEMNYSYDLKPTVVKGSEIISVPTQLAEVKSRNSTNLPEGSVPVYRASSEVKSPFATVVWTCLTIEAVLPDQPIIRIQKPFANYIQLDEAAGSAGSLLDIGKPIVIFRNSLFGFGKNG
jgi:hypothetical protein